MEKHLGRDCPLEGRYPFKQLFIYFLKFTVLKNLKLEMEG
jgi:hypothetical protein